jgi:hypothetical protein
MPEVAESFDPAELELLLEILELPEAQLTGSVPADVFQAAGTALLSKGLLRAEGFERAAVPDFADDDTPMPLTWNAEHSGYGYFSEKRNWVRIADHRLTCYRLNLRAILGMMTSALRRLSRYEPSGCLDDRIWDLGEFRLPGRSSRVSIWFARRLSDRAVWQCIRQSGRARPAPNERILLTSTSITHIVDEIPGLKILFLRNLLLPGSQLSIDPGYLVDELDQRPTKARGDLPVILADGREVRFRGEAFRFPRGEKQRRVIKLLHDGAAAGQRSASSAEIVTVLDFEPRTRIRDIFKNSPAWGRLIHESAGICSFCWSTEFPTE